MNKWQKAYSELKAFQSEWYESKFRSYPLELIVGVLIMLVEDKLNEVAE